MPARSRRRFLRGSLALAGLGLLSACATVAPQAQQPARVYRVGFLGNFPSRQWDALREGLRELGYVEGQTVTTEERWSEGILEHFPRLAAELIALKIDVIVASGNPAARAAKGASGTVPIVSPNLSNPVGAGFAASLAHPGGSVTGLSFLGLELDGKRLELLRETAPQGTRVAFLADGASMVSAPWLREAVQALGVQLQGLVVHGPDDFDPAFRDATSGQAQALLVSVGAIFQLHRTRILDFAARQRLPAMYPVTEFVEDGGLMYYGPNQPNQFRRAAWYVDKILRGTDPAALPIEQPTRFDFVINLKTVQAIGLTIPQSVLQQATEVIQ